jgi:hypothetical protein
MSKTIFHEKTASHYSEILFEQKKIVLIILHHLRCTCLSTLRSLRNLTFLRCRAKQCEQSHSGPRCQFWRQQNRWITKSLGYQKRHLFIWSGRKSSHNPRALKTSMFSVYFSRSFIRINLVNVGATYPGTNRWKCAGRQVSMDPSICGPWRSRMHQICPHFCG